MRHCYGSLLLESLIAVSVLFILITSIIGIFPVVRRGLQCSQDQISAANLARNILENARCLYFDNILPESGTFTVNSIRGGQTVAQIYSYNVDVQAFDLDKKQVWVTLNWQEMGANRQFVLETLIVSR
jgi:Tfp pilus assembly protein PilV